MAKSRMKLKYQNTNPLTDIVKTYSNSLQNEQRWQTIGGQ